MPNRRPVAHTLGFLSHSTEAAQAERSVSDRNVGRLLAKALAGVLKEGSPLGSQVGPGALGRVVLLHLLADHIDVEFLLHGF